MTNIKKAVKRKVRFNSLLKKHNTKVRHELLDADYLKKLSKKELAWYAQFTDEYVGGAVSKDKATGEVLKGHIHNTPELAKKCYDDNNRRNSDLYSVTKANNLMTSMQLDFKGNKLDLKHSTGDFIAEYTPVTDTTLTERALVAELDRKNDGSEELSFKEYVMVRGNMIAEIRDRYDQYFITIQPNAYIYYTIYDTRKLTEKQLERLLRKPKLLEKLFKNPKFMQRKKNGSDST